MRRARVFWLSGVVAAVVALAPPAAATELGWPLACTIGADCHVQNYVDRDPGPEARDYTCGFLTYDGHTGTDIRIADYVAMRRGVPVLAAAPGVVRAIRDGVADVNMRVIGREAVAKTMAGNAVVVVHDDGSEAQYSHLRQGSVAVKRGDRVQRGQALGMVGLSGMTEFPHLHFEFRRGTTPIDPFTGESAASACRTEAAAQSPMPTGALWARDVGERLGYVMSGVMKAGFSDKPPTIETIEEGEHERATLGRDAPLITFWVLIYGARMGDIATYRVVAPDGRVMLTHRDPVGRNQAQRMGYVAKQRTADWAPGIYRGVFELRRGNPAAPPALSVERALVVR